MKTMMKKISSPSGNRIIDIINWATEKLRGEQIISPRLNAETLLSLTTGLSRINLYVNFEKPLSTKEINDFKSLLQRRLHHEPLQYITGFRGFRYLELEVNPQVMIPRPETELLVERGLEKMSLGRREAVVLDLGTGSGCIALSIAYENPSAQVHASDISTQALEVARKNAVRLGLQDRVRFYHSDLFESLPEELKGRIDFILSNPPYVSEEEFQLLPPEVKNHEPRIALLAKENGISFHLKILQNAKFWLSPRGWLFMEAGAHQLERITFQAIREGYVNVETLFDYAGLPRFLEAQLDG